MGRLSAILLPGIICTNGAAFAASEAKRRFSERLSMTLTPSEARLSGIYERSFGRPSPSLSLSLSLYGSCPG